MPRIPAILEASPFHELPRGAPVLGRRKPGSSQGLGLFQPVGSPRASAGEDARTPRSWPVSRSVRNKQLPMNRPVGPALRSGPSVRTAVRTTGWRRSASPTSLRARFMARRQVRLEQEAFHEPALRRVRWNHPRPMASPHTRQRRQKLFPPRQPVHAARHRHPSDHGFERRTTTARRAETSPNQVRRHRPGKLPQNALVPSFRSAGFTNHMLIGSSDSPNFRNRALPSAKA